MHYLFTCTITEYYSTSDVRCRPYVACWPRPAPSLPLKSGQQRHGTPRHRGSGVLGVLNWRSGFRTNPAPPASAARGRGNFGEKGRGGVAINGKWQLRIHMGPCICTARGRASVSCGALIPARALRRNRPAMKAAAAGAYGMRAGSRTAAPWLGRFCSKWTCMWASLRGYTIASLIDGCTTWDYL